MHVAAYIYKADVFCPHCILNEMGETAPQTLNIGRNAGTVEERLDTFAEFWRTFPQHSNLDRGDESTFDSDDFPKVVFSDQVRTQDDEAGPDHCGRCGEVIE